MLPDNSPVSGSMGVVVSRDFVLPRVYLALRDLLLYPQGTRQPDSEAYSAIQYSSGWNTSNRP
jgi:hypothetical protein